MQRSKPVESFPGIEGWVANDISEENAANRLTLICIDLPNIRARANALKETSYNHDQEAEAIAVMEFAQMVDDNLLQWYRTLPKEWHYRTIGIANETVKDPMTADRWPGEQHVYHDVSLASVVNDYRVSRIFCQRVIMGSISWLSPNPSHNLTTASDRAAFIIQQLVDEISACVPFHMNYDMQPMAQELGQERNGEYRLTQSLIMGRGIVDYSIYSRRSIRWLQSCVASVRGG